MTNDSLKLEDISKLYLENVAERGFRDGTLEMEVRFNTKHSDKITHNEYNNVSKRLLSSGFKRSVPHHLLRISNEYYNKKSQMMKLSNIRTNINGVGKISDYCKTNKIEQENATFERKSPFRINDVNLPPVDVNDFGFRISLQVEKNLPPSDNIVQQTLQQWNDSKKVFRYMSRCVFVHDIYPVKVELSIVKSSKTNGKYMVPEMTIKDAGVLSSVEKYEIEIEIDNTKIGIGTDYDTPKKLSNSIRKVIKYVLSGLQSTNYPISYSERSSVMAEYMQILWGPNVSNKRAKSKNFVGPSSNTLQIQNIQSIDTNSMLPNIRNNYTVTDKADGDRKLLFISKIGRIYLIDTNMQIQFTGAQTNVSEIFETIIDGEHILHDKNGKYINLYASFDVYYTNGVDIRNLFFAPQSDDAEILQFRLPRLAKIVNTMKVKSIVGNAKSPIRIEYKTFNISNDKENIFDQCNVITKKIKDGTFEYNTDGLIFTPANLGVGTSRVGDSPGNPIKTTWKHSFKWKPVENNTIDFLVEVQKDENTKDKIFTKFEGGVDLSKVSQVSQYKRLILRVGFDETKHGYVNPMQNIIDDDIPDIGNVDNNNNYRPMRFYPTSPSDDNAGICNVVLNSNDNLMQTEEGDIIEDGTIVEFRYETTKESGWKWIPLRVRHDKTADLRSGGRNYGNAYHVANSNWHSIHNPVTIKMITTGKDIPTYVGNDEVYYNRVDNKKTTQGLRDFHNLFVKKLLISKIANNGDILIDFAVGKGGDIPKWTNARLRFVFGIDVSRDNIENRKDGVCARYLQYKKQNRNTPKALFVHGNSSVNIKNKDGIVSESGKQIVDAIFGKGSKDESVLGKGVYDVFGIGEEGFDVSSIQFAIHYMFETQLTLFNFLQNVSETTKVGGHFIGTSYDGNTIFTKLFKKKKGESISIFDKDTKIWEITKQYDETEFNPDKTSIGYPIDVYQESINKTFREYLVNYKFLERVMENYGFVLLNYEEITNLEIPESTGMFSDLHNLMIKDKSNKNIKNKVGMAMNMTAGEREISFLNRYFVYKKVRSVDTKYITNMLLNQSVENITISKPEETKIQIEQNKTQIKEPQPSVADTKPKKRKIIIRKKPTLPK